ncbi:MLO-like protein 12 [Aristolochia californica]|uniref:MLO-like protein 12 n=1 Tax=Aristolochia californica TaxID=171875 RepID=UPI0035D8513B
MAQRSLEDTSTWAVAIVCAFLCSLSMLIEAALHLMTKFLKRRKRKSLNRALEKIKTGLMQLGFISLLLAIGEEPISRICVRKRVADSFLPCRGENSSFELLTSSATETSGMVPLVSRRGITELHILIFVLAVFHVLYCVLTMFLGTTKMKRWKAWEEETRSLHYRIENDSRRFQLTRQTPFGKRHLKLWSSHPWLLWPVCFLRHFRGSVTKADYFALRIGFIKAHFTYGSSFNFQKFLARAFDDDFEVVVGISFWIWMFSIFFIFFSAHGFYSYFWLPFIPLFMVLIVGTKLQVIITQMCQESQSEGAIVRGTLLVKPDDHLFWFHQPRFLLHLIHFILFQNSFQIAFFSWTWYEFGLRSCFHRETEDIVLRITMGVMVQLLCGYVTLPLYAVVTQMGSVMNKNVFTERVAKGLKYWHSLARQNLSRNESSETGQSLLSNQRETSAYMRELSLHHHDAIPATAQSATTPEITEEVALSKNITRETFNGEISFATSWKERAGGNK